MRALRLKAYITSRTLAMLSKHTCIRSKLKKHLLDEAFGFGDPLGLPDTTTSRMLAVLFCMR